MTRDQETELLKVFDQSWSRLRNVTFCHVGLNRFDWDEIRADCLIRVFAGYARYDASRPLGSWTYVVMRNTVMNEFRRRFPQDTRNSEWRYRIARPARLLYDPVDPKTEPSRQIPLDDFRDSLEAQSRLIWDLRAAGKDFYQIGRTAKIPYQTAYTRFRKMAAACRQWSRTQ